MSYKILTFVRARSDKVRGYVRMALPPKYNGTVKFENDEVQTFLKSEKSQYTRIYSVDKYIKYICVYINT